MLLRNKHVMTVFNYIKFGQFIKKYRVDEKGYEVVNFLLTSVYNSI